MATRRAIRGVLGNFLGTYTSRYTDHDGYWLFGFLVPDLRELRIDLLALPTTRSLDPQGVAARSAVVMFADQLQKARLVRSQVQKAWLKIRKLPGQVCGSINWVSCPGHNVSFSIWAVMADGQCYEREQVVFVAPHNPAVERRSGRVVIPRPALRDVLLHSPLTGTGRVGDLGRSPAEGLTVGNKWREHPKLRGRFLADHPDDLQVFVHDGGPRLSRNPAEAVWVTVTGMDGDVFHGRVLNQPHNLRTIRQGGEIRFLVADGAEFPVMVTDKYLQEREAWVIHPCRRCGFSELFDTPSDLIRVVFPNQPADAQTCMFTAFCPLCGGVQGVESKDQPASGGGEPDLTPPASQRPWWRFWG